jgi:hypothetical protein
VVMPHARLTFGGPLYEDTWSVGLHLCPISGEAGDTESIVEWTENHLTAVKNAVADYWAGSQANTQAKLSWLKLVAIGSDGRYAQEVTEVPTYEWASPVTPNLGTAVVSGGKLPPQVALCVTLRSSLRKGKGAYGRYYLPPQEFTWLSAAKANIADNAVQAVANAAQTFINALNQIDSPDATTGYRVALAPRTTSSAFVVTRLEVGDVYDTLRARRAQVPEVRLERAITHETNVA